MNSEWTDIAQAVAAIISCFVAIISCVTAIISCFIAIVGFFFVYRQVKQVENISRKDALDSLYGRAHEIHQVVLDDPGLRPFFHDGMTVPENDPKLQNKLAAYSEMLLDFYELIIYQHEFMSTELSELWKDYIKELYGNSPALREHVTKHGNWYREDMIRFLTS